jgi:hypothetical protein
MIKRLIDLHAGWPLNAGGGLDLGRILLDHDNTRANEGGGHACR